MRSAVSAFWEPLPVSDELLESFFTMGPAGLNGLSGPLLDLTEVPPSTQPETSCLVSDANDSVNTDKIGGNKRNYSQMIGSSSTLPSTVNVTTNIPRAGSATPSTFEGSSRNEPFRKRASNTLSLPLLPSVLNRNHVTNNPLSVALSTSENFPNA